MLYNYYLYWSSFSHIKVLIPLSHQWSDTDLSKVVWDYVEIYNEAIDSNDSNSSQRFIYLLALYGINKLNTESGVPLYGRKFNEEKIKKWAMLISKYMDTAPRTPEECHQMGSLLEQCVNLWESTNPSEELPSKLHFMGALHNSPNGGSNQLMDFYDELAEECGFVYTNPPFPKKSHNRKKYNKQFHNNAPFINGHSPNKHDRISDYVL